MTLGPVMMDVQGKTLTQEDRELLAHPLVGAVILFTRNFESVEQLQQLVAEIRAVRSPPLLVTVDHEGGRVQRFRKGFTVLPSMRMIGRQYDLDPVAGRLLSRQCGWLMAAELRAVGVDLSFAPCVDLDYGASSVIGDRAFHRDPRVVSELAISFMGGMREAGMSACAKHYPGHGFVVPDSHVAMPVDRRPLVDMEEDLTPYRRLIDNGVAAIMAAHVVYSHVDDKPAGFSRRWLQTELRGRLGFDGAIFTDDLSMAGASVIGDMPARAKAALAAGCDVLSVCNDRQGVLQVIDSLRGTEDPLSQVRMARLHGKPGLTRDALHASMDWQTCEGAVKGCMERPDLRLNS
ncbi:beta-N-acetylhexosaminidase [Peristeroidobacter soli]|jgi:beta-N-acetylhexosaminidase|uniref:beta-N-acetylhexosaminidase n=1 Tax=Peristeroidobacter soli TaxID=2497877 RepID=UPI00101D8B2A|nr:beta-N-acetylhexosaminidase [Peristeroidobacter soli]